MDSLWIAALGGLASGGLAWKARSIPALGWIALAPLGLALSLTGPAAALAGAIAFGIGSAASVATPPLRSLLAITIVPTAMAGALVAGLSGLWLVAHDRSWLVGLLPACAVLPGLPIRRMGAPRWVANPIACTQEPWRLVVFTARAAGDLGTTALLGLASAAIVLALPAPSPSFAASAAAALTVALALAFAGRAMRAAERRVASARTTKVAAVVADGPPPSHGIASGLYPIQSRAYRDVSATIARYAPHVRAAAAAGAELIVLPEVAVSVDTSSRATWLAAVRSWSHEHRVVIVAPFFDRDTPLNTLAVVEPDGTVHAYDKQHPARGIEPAAGPRRSIGPHSSSAREWALSTVICVDLDYRDLVAPLRRAGGVLCAPSNDWLDGFHELHHRTAIWAAVETGATIVRATGHGISSIRDGAGRVLVQASSADGPVVLVADAPSP